MKKQLKNLFFATMALFLVTSCSSDNDKDLIDGKPLGKDAITINFELENATSVKATRANITSAVRDVQIFFVRDNDVIYAPKKFELASNDPNVSFKVPEEYLDVLRESDVRVCAVANAATLQGITTYEDLKRIQIESNLNSDNPTNFVMSGESFVDLDVNNVVTLTLKRAASKFDFLVKLDSKIFTNDPYEIIKGKKRLVNSLTVKIVNFNDKTYLFPLDDRKVAASGRKTSKEVKLVENTSVAVENGYLYYELSEELYSYINKWTPINEESSATRFQLILNTSGVSGDQTLSNYVVNLQSNVSREFQVEANKHYKVSTVINDISNNSDVDAGLGVEGWKPEDLSGFPAAAKYIYIANSGKEIDVVSEDDAHDFKFDVILGQENAGADLEIQDLEVYSMDFYYNLKAAGLLGITKKTRFTNNELRRAVEYVYHRDVDVETPEKYTIEGTNESIIIESHEAKELDDLGIMIKGKQDQGQRHRTITFTSKKPFNHLDKIIKFNVVDRTNNIVKPMKIVHKGRHTISTMYPIGAGFLEFIPTLSWSQVEQTVKQLTPNLYKIAQDLVYRGDKFEGKHERYGALIVQTNVPELEGNIKVRIPDQEVKQMSYPVIFTGFDAAKILDPLKWLTYRQNVVAQSMANSYSISPKFMVSSQSAMLEYLNIQQAQAYCHTHWAIVKDPITGTEHKYTNFRLPTPQELELIVALEKDVKEVGMRKVLDNSLEFLFIVPTLEKETRYWSSEGLMKLDRKTTWLNLEFKIENLLKGFIGIGNVRCVRDVASVN